MKILIVKMSALGDIIHTFPAVSDLLSEYPDAEIDWLCEEPFIDIARLHSGVSSVIPHGRLRWKKKRWSIATLKEQIAFYKTLRQKKYDYILDAQGRIKSARVGWLAGAPVFGLDRNSATDSETRFFYKQGFPIAKTVNAVERIRNLFGQIFQYQPPKSVNFGIIKEHLANSPEAWKTGIIFLHGTTWASKHWPDEHWASLLDLAKKDRCKVLIPWANPAELSRAEKLVADIGWGEVLPKMDLWSLSGVIAHCKGAVGVDTGLMHVAAGMGVPTVSIFGSTSVALTGALGDRVNNLQADYECSPCRKKTCPKLTGDEPPCYKELPAEKVWNELDRISKGGL